MAMVDPLNDTWNETASPRKYWYDYGRNKYPLLFRVAVILFSIPCSQAASERYGFYMIPILTL